MAVRRTKEEWEGIIAVYKESGQSQRAFCREQGLSVKTLRANMCKSGAKESYTKNPPARRSAEEWIRLISEQRASGMSRSEWCIKNEVKTEAMISAARRLMAQNQKEPDSEGIEFKLVTEEENPPEKTSCDNWGIRIRSGDLDIEVSADYPVEKLTDLIVKLVKA